MSVAMGLIRCRFRKVAFPKAAMNGSISLSDRVHNVPLEKVMRPTALFDGWAFIVRLKVSGAAAHAHWLGRWVMYGVYKDDSGGGEGGEHAWVNALGKWLVVANALTQCSQNPESPEERVPPDAAGR